MEDYIGGVKVPKGFIDSDIPPNDYTGSIINDNATTPRKWKDHLMYKEGSGNDELYFMLWVRKGYSWKVIKDEKLLNMLLVFFKDYDKI